MTRSPGLCALGIFLAATTANVAVAQPAPDPLAEGFRDPPASARPRATRIDARFRIAGKIPELWHADSGRTVVPLDLAAGESVFVLFRHDASGAAATTLATIAPLDRSTTPGIRHFSGIATCTSSFTLPHTVRSGAPLMLDLGQVGDLAEVRVNGRPVGTAWHAPYRLDIGAAAKPGRNRIEIRVANTWVNRLIGDAQPGAKKITWTAMPSYRADAPLRPAGLIGAVTIGAAR